MSCNANTSFTRVTNIGNTLLNSELESNLKSFLDWSFLGIGGWSNITIPTSGAYGGTFDNLRLVDDPAYTAGQVWETPRKDWVWETGTEYAGYNPIDISGVWIDGILKETGDATYGHHYNYPLGRVVFDSAISSSTTVQLEYSYRNVQTYIADQAPWWDELQYNSLRVDDPTFNNLGSGSWGILANHRVQMPAVVVETVPRRRLEPYELGNTSSVVYQDVLFHVIAESRWWRNQLVDIISLQKDTSVRLYDTDKVIEKDVFPLDFRGMVVSPSSTYSGIVNDPGLQGNLCRFNNVIVTEMESYNNRLHEGTIRVTFETIFV